MFEPFFTTKEVGKGTGLGLSQVYGFAKQSGGTATVTSTVGRGTAITLYLPRTHELPAPSIARSEPEAASRRAGTVLLVEDNPEVAEVATAYLQQLGYMVKQVASAQRGAGVARQRSEDRSGVLRHPDAGRHERSRARDTPFASAIRAMPVLLCTGYSSSAQDAVRQGFVVLQKPFDLAALDQGLREALRGKVERTPAQRAVG